MPLGGAVNQTVLPRDTEQVPLRCSQVSQRCFLRWKPTRGIWSPVVLNNPRVNLSVTEEAYINTTGKWVRAEEPSLLPRNQQSLRGGWHFLSSVKKIASSRNKFLTLEGERSLRHLLRLRQLQAWDGWSLFWKVETLEMLRAQWLHGCWTLSRSTQTQQLENGWTWFLYLVRY